MVTLTVTLGVPASGKSTWAATQPGWHACTDPSRTGLIDNRSLVESLQRETRRQLLNGGDVITDGCNTARGLRRSWLRVGRDCGARCVLAIVECDTEEALRRNAARPLGERVTHQRMLRYLERFPFARSEVTAEGWDEVTYPTSPPPAAYGMSRRW